MVWPGSGVAEIVLPVPVLSTTVQLVAPPGVRIVATTMYPVVLYR